MCVHKNSRNLTITSGVKLVDVSDNLSACLKDCRLTVTFPTSAMNILVNPKNWDSIFEPVINGNLESQENISLKIAVVTGFNFNSDIPNTVNVECLVSEVTTGEFKIDGDRNKQWLIQLSNLKLIRGDISFSVPIPLPNNPSIDEKSMLELINLHKTIFPNREETTQEKPDEFKISPGQKWKHKIIFQWAAREWELIDDKFVERKTDLFSISIPVISGSLITEYQPGDTEYSVLEWARNITLLLSFALGRDVQPYCIELKDNNSTIYSHELCPDIRPFNYCGQTILDNWEAGNIKTFLESAETVFNADSDWWTITIAWFVNAAFIQVVEIKVALLNVLLERTARYVIGDKTSYKDKGHPPFNNAIESACDTTGILSIVDANKPRNAILHQGDLSNEFSSFDEIIKYSLQLEGTIALLILRKMGFDGSVFLPHYGNDVLLIEDILKGQSSNRTL